MSPFCSARRLICKIQVRLYVKQKEFQGIQATREEKDAFCSPRARLRELAEAVGSLCDFEKFDKAPIQSRSCTELDVNTADRDIIHQLLHLGLMACRRQTCVMCIRRIPAHSFFHVRISAGSTVSRLTNGFSNPLVCWKFFQPPLLKRRPKTYLNASAPSDSCLSRTPSREKETQAGEAKDIGKAQIMRCQAGQTVIVNYIYSDAFGEQP